MRYAVLLVMLAMVVACNADKSPGRDEGGFSMQPDGGMGCVDADSDGIADGTEGGSDADGDGKPNNRDDDSDGDGVTDADERVNPPCMAPIDSDLDLTADYLDLDSDGDGVPDAPDTTGLDTDGDGKPDSRDDDDDGDGLIDAKEIGDVNMPRDYDGDGVPDYKDNDSDNDGVRDSLSAQGDLDGDGVVDYLDDDTDGDGLLDIHEVGDMAGGARDSDDDGTPDYLDPDADDDGLADGAEDKNGNGIVDAGESSPILKDSDADGADDLVEQAAMTDASDPTKNPQADGNFVFVVPYEKAPSPEQATLDFATTISRADVVFSMDTTGSMGGALENLKAGLSAQIVPDLQLQIPDIGIGITNYEDVPTGSFGGPGDLPFELGSPITTDLMTAQAALTAMFLGGGGDGPESGIEALYQIATGSGLAWPADPVSMQPAGSIPPFDMMFRPGAFPIIIQITDADNHSSATYGALVPEAASREDAFVALEMIGARVIVVTVGLNSFAITDHLEIVNRTGAVVPTSAFGTTGQCLTGFGGAAEPADANGQCPLRFNVDGSGTGLGTSIVDAVEALAGSASLDIDARPVNEADNPGGVDAVAAFLERVTPNTAPSGTTMCVPGLPVEDRLGGDGKPDTFVDVSGGVRVCFDVVPKMNTTVMPTTEPQLFRARIDVYGDNITVLDDRAVWFVVPPKPPKPGLM